MRWLKRLRGGYTYKKSVNRKSVNRKSVNKKKTLSTTRNRKTFKSSGRGKRKTNNKRKRKRK